MGVPEGGGQTMSEIPRTLGLEPFCRFSAEVDVPTFVGQTPLGHRVVSQIKNSEFDCGRFVAKQRGPAVDSVLVGPDGTAFIEMHLVARTIDNAFVLVNFDGRANWGDGPEARVCRMTVTFETEFGDLQWLNSALAVSLGTHTESRIDYQIYMLT
jgi:Protein of unknown function (DUF3237)